MDDRLKLIIPNFMEICFLFFQEGSARISVIAKLKEKLKNMGTSGTSECYLFLKSI